ncbi:MAG: hypothetical protein QG577_2352, partial [Thermodesulfobacteriota bacterium]|nr:hypothetical protein [Thermodesulfobacteriota bacterium]
MGSSYESASQDQRGLCVTNIGNI